MEAGAATVPLAKAAPAAKPAATPEMGGTQQLPKATVQLAKGTQGLGKSTGPPSAPLKRAEDSGVYEEKDPEAGLAPLAIVCTVLAMVLMCLNLLGSDRAFFAEAGQESAFMVPPPQIPKWETPSPAGDGTHVSEFSKTLSVITAKYK